MIQKIIKFIMDLFGLNKESKKEKVILEKKEVLENKIKEIENEENSINDNINYLNK